MTEKGKQAVQLVFDACIFFGAQLSTAHKVCALMAEDIERWEKQLEAK